MLACVRVRACVCVCAFASPGEGPFAPSAPVVPCSQKLRPSNSVLLAPLLRLWLRILSTKTRHRMKIIWPQTVGWGVVVLWGGASRRKRLVFKIRGSAPSRAFHLPAAQL